MSSLDGNTAAGPLLAHGENLESSNGDGLEDLARETPAEQAAAARERTGKAAYAITAFHLVARISGFLEGLLLSRYFGAGSITDAYFAASKIPWSIFSFGEQLLTHSFLPPFVEAREKRGEGSAWKLASLVATIQFLILIVVVGAGFALAPDLVRTYCRHFTPAELDLTTTLARIMLPAVLLMSLSSLTYVLLNAYKQFALPAFGDAALKGGVVIAGFALWRILGIKAFALGLILGGCIKLATHLYGLRSKLGRMRWNLDTRDAAARKLLVLMVPLMASNVLSTVRPYLDNWFAGGHGQVSALNFAFKLTNLPFMLIPYALGIALFPFLAEMATRNDREQIGRALISALRMITFLLVPITAIYLVLALPLVETVFMTGKFTPDDAARVVSPLVWYSVGMVPVGIETVVLQIYFSLSDTRTPMYVAYGTFLVYLGAAYGGAYWLAWGAAGVAVAITVSKLVKDVILLGILAPRLHGLNLGGLGSFLLRLAIATTFMVLALWGTVKVAFHGPTTEMRPAAVTAVPGGKTAAGSSKPLPRPSAAASTPGIRTSKSAAPAPHPKKKKKVSKVRAALVFVGCAMPGGIVFLLAAYWLQIAELGILYAVLERRIWPLFLRAGRALMAEW